MRLPALKLDVDTVCACKPLKDLAFPHDKVLEEAREFKFLCETFSYCFKKLLSAITMSPVRTG